ncbi:MAG: tRNA (guanine(10)-N(2))-dimethyltransferase [archaeon]|nr:MAG: tRNA (guanine(10)-N(2))-dimethyltransferase [archaeon]
MKTKEIREGSVSIKVPEVRMPEEGEVFYNPAMAFDRSISVCFCELAGLEKALDALSATGIRALRYKKEAGIGVTANDCNPKAVKLIRDNMKRNKIKVGVSEKDANILMRQEHFDFVDLDPFGSPIGFVDSACASIGRKGFLAFTATDKAPLSGTYPKVSERRYGIRSMKTDYYNELGLRILLSAVMRIFARYERRFTPLLSYSRLHYFRIYGKVEKGVKRINRQLRDWGVVSHCFKCGWRDLALKKKCPLCGEATQFCRVYLGGIQDADFLDKLVGRLQSRMFVQEEKLVNKIREEISFPLYYDLHYLYKKTGRKPDKMETTMEKLREKGFRASRTHFCPTAVKTNASFKDIIELI